MKLNDQLRQRCLRRKTSLTFAVSRLFSRRPPKRLALSDLGRRTYPLRSRGNRILQARTR